MFHNVQEKETEYLEERLSTVRELEAFTGINFFPLYTIEDQNTIELKIVPLTADF